MPSRVAALTQLITISSAPDESSITAVPYSCQDSAWLPDRSAKRRSFPRAESPGGGLVCRAVAEVQAQKDVRIGRAKVGWLGEDRILELAGPDGRDPEGVELIVSRETQMSL